MTRNIGDPYRDWDAAYVLGALVPTERQEYEQHLAECEECSAAVAELAGLPGILGKLPADEAATVGATASQPSSHVLRGLSAKVRRHRLRSRMLAGAIAVAACAASVGITLAVTGPDAGAGHPQTGQIQAGGTALHFSAVTASSLTATGSLLPEAWGTRIDWTCTYTAVGPSAARTSTPPERYPSGLAGPVHGYALFVTDADGATTRVASWVAAPGSVVTPTATTRIPAADIRRVEIRATATGRTLLAATP
jgi:RNA polymerase sigma-70 factor (ECF subfamily)